MQAQVPLNMKPIETTGPTSSTDSKDQNQKKIWPYNPGKGVLKHSKIGKMKRQRNIVQMKEQGKNSQDQINEEEIDKLSEKEFRIKMIQNLKNRMDKIQESFHIYNEDREEIKNKQW